MSDTGNFHTLTMNSDCSLSRDDVYVNGCISQKEDNRGFISTDHSDLI